MTETEWAYTAGIIDGEGCLSITFREYPSKWELSVSVGGTDKRLLIWLSDRFGGAITPMKRTGNRQPAYLWRVPKRQLQSMLNGVMPYLVVKREQAEVLLVAATQNLAANERRDCALVIRGLNRRGLVSQKATEPMARSDGETLPL